MPVLLGVTCLPLGMETLVGLKVLQTLSAGAILLCHSLTSALGLSEGDFPLYQAGHFIQFSVLCLLGLLNSVKTSICNFPEGMVLLQTCLPL